MVSRHVSNPSEMVSPRSRDRRIVLSSRTRIFPFEDRHCVHVAGVPLVYMTCGAAMADMLHGLREPATPDQVLARYPRHEPRPLNRFLDALVTAGVLIDPDSPDDIHAFRGRPEAVRELTLFPTNSCNLRCVYCYATSGPGSGPRLSIEHAFAAIDGFFDELPPAVQFVVLNFHGGGEPTTNFAVMTASWTRFRDAALSRGLKARVATITNGTFGPAVLRELEKPEWSVLVSYDGNRQAEQRPTAAGADSRARVVANIRALVAAGKAVTTRATVTREGLSGMPHLVTEAADLGVRQVQIEPSSLVGRGANLSDGPPDPMDFADAYLGAFDLGLRLGVRVTSTAWTSRRPGDGAYCGAQTGLTQVTPDGFVSCCTEVVDGSVVDDPFIVGSVDIGARRLEIWPVREAAMRSRLGYELPTCSTCAFVDTCGGGCASRARAQSGDLFARDEDHCVAARRVNPELIAAIAEERIVPDPGWQPISATLPRSSLAAPDMWARMVAIVPPMARRRWNANPHRRPLFPADRDNDPFFHLPAHANSFLTVT